MLALTQDTIKSSSALACDQMMQESIACVQASKLAAALSRGATAESSINMMRQLDQLDMTHRILETTELMPQIKTLCTYPDPKLQGLVRCIPFSLTTRADSLRAIVRGAAMRGTAV